MANENKQQKNPQGGQNRQPQQGGQQPQERETRRADTPMGGTQRQGERNPQQGQGNPQQGQDRTNRGQQ
jgi:hypothetical protein